MRTSENPLLKLSEKGRKGLQRIALRTTQGPISFSVYRPNPRSERCSYPFSDSFSRTFVNKRLLVRQLALRGLIGAQPQRDVGRLHRLPHHPYEIIAQGV